MSIVQSQHIQMRNTHGFGNVLTRSIGTLINQWPSDWSNSNTSSGNRAVCFDTLLFEDFQSQAIPGTWLNLDLDGNTDANGRPMNWYIMNDAERTSPGDSNWCAVSSSWFTPLGQANNWLITTAVNPCPQTVLAWDEKPFEGPGFMDGYVILVSTTGTATNDFTDTIFVKAEDVGGGAGTPGPGVVHSSYSGNNGLWEHRQQSLGMYDNQTIYIAIVHNSDDDNLTMFDNIFVGVPTCAPTAGFTQSSNDLMASFTDISSVNGTATWLWDFGDGNTSNLQNPTHTYAFPGIYTVCLITTDTCSSDTSCAAVTITCSPPSAGFSITSNDLMATYTDTSTSNSALSTWLWDFGDGNTSNLQSPTHTYVLPGVYTVCLITTNACGGSDTACSSVTITCSPPSTGFSYLTNNLMASYTDTSTSNSIISTWLWDFGDGNTSSLQHPTHTYALQGVYTVCLITTNACGSSDTTCNVVTISCPQPDAGFNMGQSSLTVNFTDTSLTGGGITSWLWDFGDSYFSNLQNPSHTYALAGTYTVCLIITDSCGSTDTACSMITVTNNTNLEDHPVHSVGIYPNPVNEQLTLDQLDPMIAYSITIINNLGQIIESRRIVGQAMWLLNTSSYTPGQYTIRILVDDHMATRRFIKIE